MILSNDALAEDVFSSYVRSLAPSGEPSDEALDEVWTEVRRVLRRALQRRGLWDRPPIYVGVSGHEPWTTRETADRRGLPAQAQDALDELATDFYVETFVERLPMLRRYVARGDSIKKLVSLRVRQFLHQRQQASDPLGHRLFQWLRDALQEAVDQQQLQVKGDDVRRRQAKIHNGTVFLLSTSTEQAPTNGQVLPDETVLAAEDALSIAVGRWNDDLLVDWATARGAEVGKMVGRLAARLGGLRETGLQSFTFKALVDVFKRDVRTRLAGLLGDPTETSLEAEALGQLEQRDRIRELGACVEAGVRGGGGQQRTRDQLLKLWRFLEMFALAASDSGLPQGASPKWVAALEEENLPSHRRLSGLLGIRHDRFPTLLARLKDEAQRCLAALGGTGPGSSGESEDETSPDTLANTGAPAGPEASLDAKQNLRHHLKRLTAEAYGPAEASGRTVSSRRDLAASSTVNGPVLGDLYHFESCPEPGVEWLVVEFDDATGDGLVIPADSLSWIGSADVAANDDSALGPLVLRSDLGLWLGLSILTAERRVGAVAATDLERVRSHRRQPPVAVSMAAQEIDLDTEYRDWRRSLEGARNAVARVEGGQIEEPRSVSELPSPEVGAPAVVAVSPEDEERFSIPSEASENNVEPLERVRPQRSRMLWALAASGIAVIAGSALLASWAQQRGLESRLSDLQDAHGALLRELVVERLPQVAVPWLLAPFQATRGETIRFSVPANARSIGLLVTADNGDRIEISDAAGDHVWSAVVDQGDSRDEALIVLPATLMPPGRYQVNIWHGDGLPLNFDLLIEVPRASE